MSDQTITVQYIDLTPTWEQSAHILCVIMESGTPEGKRIAKAEIVRMGAIIDQMKRDEVRK